MSPSRTRTTIAAAAIAALVLAGCADSDDDAADPTSTTVPATPPEADGPDDTTTTTATEDEGPETDGGVISASDGVLSDGVWEVGEAGTVEFAVGPEGLELIEVVANDGWSYSIDVEVAREIEVDFEQGPREYEIEIEYENGILEIEIDLDIDPAEPGTFELGPAGTATLSVSGGTVTLDDLTVSDGWSVTEQDTSDGEVEVELRRDNVRWELDAEVDDGVLEVEIDFEIEGRFP